MMQEHFILVYCSYIASLLLLKTDLFIDREEKGERGLLERLKLVQI